MKEFTYVSKECTTSIFRVENMLRKTRARLRELPTSQDIVFILTAVMRSVFCEVRTEFINAV
jgi:hypothetical protein